MSNSKSTILSKAEKMRLKKNSKKEAIPSIIQIIDSDQSNHQQKKITIPPLIISNLINQAQSALTIAKQKVDSIEAKEDKSPDVKSKEILASNTINYDRLKKMNPLEKTERKAVVLKTEQCGDGDDVTKYEGRSLVVYRREGKETTSSISENYLKQRASNIEEDFEKWREKQEEKQRQKEKEKAQGEQKQAQENEVQQQEPKKRKTQNKNIRYFDLIDNNEDSDDEDLDSEGVPKKKSFKCFRCGEKGHIAKNCHLEERITCIHCLGAHHFKQCTNQICFRCNQTGHVSQECQSTGIKCRKCKKLGHIQKECGTICMLDYNSISDREIRERYSESDLKNLRCLAGCREKKGHFNCFKYGSRPQKIYGSSKRNRGDGYDY